MRAAIILLVFTSLGVISVESQGKIRCGCAVVQAGIYHIFLTSNQMHLSKHPHP